MVSKTPSSSKPGPAVDISIQTKENPHSDTYFDSSYTETYAFIIIQEDLPIHHERLNKTRKVYHDFHRAEAKLRYMKAGMPKLWPKWTVVEEQVRFVGGFALEGFKVYDENGVAMKRAWVERTVLAGGCGGQGSGSGSGSGGREVK